MGYKTLKVRKEPETTFLETKPLAGPTHHYAACPAPGTYRSLAPCPCSFSSPAPPQPSLPPPALLRPPPCPPRPCSSSGRPCQQRASIRRLRRPSLLFLFAPEKDESHRVTRRPEKSSVIFCRLTFRRTSVHPSYSAAFLSCSHRLCNTNTDVNEALCA